MFTGIIQSVGIVDELKPTGKKSFTLKFTAKFNDLKKDPIELGESIAINGTCLTVTEIKIKKNIKNCARLTFDLAPETVERTSLSKLAKLANSKKSRKINLERSLKMGDRLSGHWVQGHVDGTATLKKIEALSGGSFELTFKLDDPNLRKYCVKKGSISLDGISLTIHEIKLDQLKFQIIPHTWKETNLSDLLVGEKVNIEVDVLAKYIENFGKN